MRLDLLLSDISDIDSITPADAGKTDITSVCYDSRKACMGSLFVCLEGAVVDGHDYIKKAYENGARAFLVRRDTELLPDAVYVKHPDTRKALALLSARFFGFPARKLTLVGITGTKGKTSISFILHRIMEKVGIRAGIIGTTGIIYGNKRIPSDNSTPESYEIHRHLADMLACGVTHVVMEVTSQGLMMHRTYGINFNIALYTNLSPDHIGAGEHTDFEDYKNCKKILFSQCVAVAANADDSFMREVTENFGGDIKTYGMSPDCLYRAENIDFRNDGRKLSTAFTLSYGGRSYSAELNIPGRFNVYNALAAIAAADMLGIGSDSVLSGLSEAVIEGRMQTVDAGTDFTVIIDYAHNELSMQSLYETVAIYPHGRIFTVFGCGGNRAHARRYDMGRIASLNSDLCIVTSDNPRHESLDTIIEDIKIGIAAGREYTVIKDRKAAICKALSLARKNDVVLVVGKGHQHYEEVGDVKFPFNEEDIVREYVASHLSHSDM